MLGEFMTENYLTTTEAVQKYTLNPSKFQFAIKQANLNGLYKVIHRVRNRILLRKDYFEKWLESNDIKSASRPRKSSPRTIHSRNRLHHKEAFFERLWD